MEFENRKMGLSNQEPESIPPEPSAVVREELLAREPIFHRAEFGTSQADFAAMIVDDYWEIGASGRRYDRNFVLEVLEERHRQPHPDDWAIEDFAIRQLGPTVFLVTYNLWQGPRRTRRATVWEKSTGNWRAVYHQGTIVEAAAPSS
jgi:hypothetical protein